MGRSDRHDVVSAALLITYLTQIFLKVLCFALILLSWDYLLVVLFLTVQQFLNHSLLAMSDDGNSASANVASPVILTDNNGAAPVPAGVKNHEDKSDPIPFFPSSKERDFFERPSRRPSFIEHLADSREAQFPTQHISELERYFVRRHYE